MAGDGSTTRLACAWPVAAGLRRGAMTSSFDVTGTGLVHPPPWQTPFAASERRARRTRRGSSAGVGVRSRRASDARGEPERVGAIDLRGGFGRGAKPPAESALGAWRFRRRAVGRVERQTLQVGVADAPSVEDPGELGHVLDRAVLGAELDDGHGLLVAEAVKLNELQGIGEGG